MIDWTLTTATWAANSKDLREIRNTVFVHEQGVPANLEIDGKDERAIHIVARSVSGRAIATGRILDNGHIGRMAVLARWRNRGVGSAILQRLIAMAREFGHERVYLNAQCSAEPFYARAGFTPEGDTFLDAGIPHRHMYLNLQHAQDLR